MLRSDCNDFADDSRGAASGIFRRRRFGIFPAPRLGFCHGGFLAAGARYRGRRLRGLSEDYPLGRTERCRKPGLAASDVAAVVFVSNMAAAKPKMTGGVTSRAA